MLSAMQGIQAQVHGGGHPQSMKCVKLTPPNKVGLSKDALFLESKSGEEVASEESEASQAGLAELEGTI